MKFKKHIFICTNERAAGERQSCGEKHGLELVAAFKKSLLDKGLKTQVRAQRAGCLDACESGPTLVVYPEGVYYRNVQLSDVEEIIQKHIVENTPVERLVLQA
ncbi:MAG: Ferredoxin, 2Fe-2S [Bacteroidia bacterium]|nr:Ferredoxin, 2Fe-2S [Bacteroidia bacterium]